MGTMQSGNYNSDVLALSRYTDILEAATEDADRIIRDPCGTDTAHAYERMVRDSASDNSNII